jgi:four helix bundle protein
LRLIKFVSTLPKNQVTVVIIPQLLRSGTSILANYIEARASSSKKEFTNFFQHSLKSANETVVWLTLLRDTDNCDKNEVAYLLKELEEIANMFAAAILRLKGKK